jgi:hypothetical protein
MGKAWKRYVHRHRTWGANKEKAPIVETPIIEQVVDAPAQVEAETEVLEAETETPPPVVEIKTPKTKKVVKETKPLKTSTKRVARKTSYTKKK